MVVTLGQQYNVEEKPTVILYTYINRHAGTPNKQWHEEVISLQPMIPPKRFDISPPLTGGCSEDLYTFRFFFKKQCST